MKAPPLNIPDPIPEGPWNEHHPVIRALIADLNPEAYHTPATIAKRLRSTSDRKSKRLWIRARVGLERITARHRFPQDGDSTLSIGSGPPVPAWSGTRWLDTIGPHNVDP